MTTEWIAVLQAADAAARWHVHQRRKGAAEEPYINHLLEVAMLVTQATKGTDRDLAIAAVLHDAIEDQEVPRKAIAEVFGENVAKLVEEVTDDKSLAKEERKRLQVEHAPRKSDRAKILKLADKTSNLRAIAASPPREWSTQRRLEYVAWARRVAEGLVGASDWLEREFERAARQADEAITRLSDENKDQNDLYAPNPTIHPKRNDEGREVTIKNPSQPTDPSSWTDPSRVARALPGGIVPASINGIPVTRSAPPTERGDWEKLVLNIGASEAQPLRTKPGKKASAGAVVVEPDGRIWLVEPTNGYWGYERTFPKGTHDADYSLAATAAKEVFEETGLLVEIGPTLIDVERSASVCRYFLGWRIGGDPSDMGWESQAVCLVPLAQLSEEMLPSEHDRPVLVAIQNSWDGHIWQSKDQRSRTEETRSL